MAAPRQVISNVYPFLRIVVRSRNWQNETLAPIDTGFDGALAIPISAGGMLGAPDASTDWEQADGSIAEAPIYFGSIEIPGFPLLPNEIVVALGNEYILRRQVLDHFEITLDHGERVIVRP